MFKKLAALFLCLFIFTLCIPVFASEADIDFIIDDANILTDDEEAYFNSESSRIYEQYGVPIYIVVSKLYEETGNDSLYEGSSQYMDRLGLTKTDGMLLYFDHSYGYFVYRSTYKDAYLDLDNDITNAYYAASFYYDFAQAFYAINENYIQEQEQIDAQNEQMLNSITISNVMDIAGLLSEEQESELQAIANNIASEHEIQTYIMTIDDYNIIQESYYIEDAAMAFYTDNNLGYGEGKEGALLMLSMKERDFTYIIYGDRTHDIFTESARIYIEENFLEYFAVNDFHGGFLSFFEDTYEEPNMFFVFKLLRSIDINILFIAFVLSLGIAFMDIKFHKKALNTFKKKQNALDYVSKGGVNIRIQQDVYTHTTTTRTKINTSSGGGGGGSSRSFSSGGFSGRSGKF